MSIPKITSYFYFGYNFFDCYLHLYCDNLKHNIWATVSPDLLQVSIVYLKYRNIEMICDTLSSLISRTSYPLSWGEYR